MNFKLPLGASFVNKILQTQTRISLTVLHVVFKCMNSYQWYVAVANLNGSYFSQELIGYKPISNYSMSRTSLNMVCPLCYLATSR